MTLSLFPSRKAVRVLSSFFLLLLLAGIASCGGGPIVATSTGRVLYLATTSGLYGYSIMSDSTLKPLSPAPMVSGSFNMVTVTPGTPSGQGSPLLMAVASANSISSWPLNSDGTINTGGEAPISISSCSPFTTPTGLVAVPGNQYVLAVSGTTAGTTVNLATIPLPSTTGLTCATASTSSSSYPIQPALDCAVAGSSGNCVLFLTISSSSTGSGANPASPVEDTPWNTSTTGTLTSSSGAYTCTAASGCPLGVAFDPTTLYFYGTFNQTTPPTLQSIAPETATSTATTSFPASAPLNYPCVDMLGNVAYVPTANGYLYSVSLGMNGSVGSPQALLSPGSTGSSGVLNMTSCAVSSNP